MRRGLPQCAQQVHSQRPERTKCSCWCTERISGPRYTHMITRFQSFCGTEHGLWQEGAPKSFTKHQKPTQNSTGYDSTYRALERARTIYSGKYPETASPGFGRGAGIGGSRQEGPSWGLGQFCVSAGVRVGWLCIVVRTHGIISLKSAHLILCEFYLKKLNKYWTLVYNICVEGFRGMRANACSLLWHT